MIRQYIYGVFLKVLAKLNEYKNNQIKKEYNFDKTVTLFDVNLIGNIEIGKYTYANNGSTFSSGKTSKVAIGKYCAVGRYVHITAKGHSLSSPTADEDHPFHEHVEADTIIGDYVWIGDNAFIKHGIRVGDYAIIGANAVVTKDVKPFEIVGGVPAKHIRFNTEHCRYNKV